MSNRSWRWAGALGALVTMLVFADGARADMVTLSAMLDGAQEVGGGDADGMGVALIMIDTSTNAITWAINAMDIDLPLTGAHIHQGAAGANGSILVDFNATFMGTTTDTDAGAIAANPSGFYVNLHNAAFPGGAIRGQLTLVPEPSSLALIGLGGLGLLGYGLRRRAREAA